MRDKAAVGSFQKMQIINKFYLQAGVESGGDYLGDPKSMEEIQRDIISKFDCKIDWPICMFDFTYKNKIPNFFCFKVEPSLTSFI